MVDLITDARKAVDAVIAHPGRGPIGTLLNRRPPQLARGQTQRAGKRHLPHEALWYGDPAVPVPEPSSVS